MPSTNYLTLIFMYDKISYIALYLTVLKALLQAETNRVLLGEILNNSKTSTLYKNKPNKLTR